MLRVVIVLALCLAVQARRRSGTAFPIDAENYVISAFQDINRYLKWDETNYLVDLSGHYASCENIGLSGSFIKVNEVTNGGQSIAAYVDETYGANDDVGSLNQYIRTIIDDWTLSQYGSEIYQQILHADWFGCSVRAGCNGRVSVACLFSPRYESLQIAEGTQNAYAFTEEQYKKAEGITGEKWDFDHFLEDLSGYETTCNLMYEDNHQFPYARQMAEDRGIMVEYVYGNSRNRGQTEPAMLAILRRLKKPAYSKEVGCSLIPDCLVPDEEGDMYVVVGCLFRIDYTNLVD